MDSVTRRPLGQKPPLTPRYPHLPSRHGLTPKQVVKNQRGRIFGALVSLVTTQGYAATTVKDIATVANVSRTTMYKEFDGKEDCFLWAYDVIVRRAMKRVNAAYRRETDWTAQLRSGFAVFIEEVLNEPAAAQLVLVEALGAGPAALGRMDAASGAFERMVRSSFAASPGGIAVPSPIVKGIVGGIARVIRQHLLEDRVEDLPGVADELFNWMLAYHAHAGTELALKRHRAALAPLKRSTPTSEHDRMLHAAASVAAKHGYANLTVDSICRSAGVPDERFYDAFPGGIDHCFVRALLDLGLDVIAGAQAAARTDAGEWPQRVCAGLQSILVRIARDPIFARIAFIEVFATGPGGIATRSKLMHAFSDLLLSDVPADIAPSAAVAEAIVGAVWQLAHHAAWRDASPHLPALGDFAAYLVLAPLLGGTAALQEIRTRP